MEGIISREEGLAAGIVLTAEEGDAVVRALQILTRHAEGIRNSGRPFAVEASEVIARTLLPVGEMFLNMVECGMVLQHGEPPTDQELMNLLNPDPWGQAGGE
jgi:hypothetical protein